MLTATLVPKPIRIPDGWSRADDGSIHVDNLRAFQLFMAFKGNEVPAYAVNLVYEKGMSFEAFLEKNGIDIEDVVRSA